MALVSTSAERVVTADESALVFVNVETAAVNSSILVSKSAERVVTVDPAALVSTNN